MVGSQNYVTPEFKTVVGHENLLISLPINNWQLSYKICHFQAHLWLGVVKWELFLERGGNEVAPSRHTRLTTLRISRRPEKKSSEGHWGMRPSLQDKLGPRLPREYEKVTKTRNLRE